MGILGWTQHPLVMNLIQTIPGKKHNCLLQQLCVREEMRKMHKLESDSLIQVFFLTVQVITSTNSNVFERLGYDIILFTNTNLN